MNVPTEVSSEVWIALRSAELLERASDNAVLRLARAANVVTYRKGDRILARDETAREIGIVMRGRARGVHFADDGRSVTVLNAVPGKPVGLMAALRGTGQKNTYEAIENGTAIVWVPSYEFERLMDAEPQVMRTVITMLARRMEQVITLVQILSADVPARVAIYIGLLLEQQEPSGPGPFEVDLEMSRVQLASQLGTVPETLSRAFNALQTEGVIESHGRRIVVLDRDALIARSNGVL